MSTESLSYRYDIIDDINFGLLERASAPSLASVEFTEQVFDFETGEYGPSVPSKPTEEQERLFLQASASIKVHPKPLSARERDLRADNPETSHSLVRWFLYQCPNTDKQAAAIKRKEDAAQNRHASLKRARDRKVAKTKLSKRMKVDTRRTFKS